MPPPKGVVVSTRDELEASVRVAEHARSARVKRRGRRMIEVIDRYPGTLVLQEFEPVDISVPIHAEHFEARRTERTGTDRARKRSLVLRRIEQRRVEPVSDCIVAKADCGRLVAIVVRAVQSQRRIASLNGGEKF